MSSAIDAVVFDIGNVLIRWDPFRLYRTMGFADDRTRAMLAETRLLEINHRELDAGAPAAAVISRLASAFPQWRDAIEAFDIRWAEMLGGAIDENVALMAQLKSLGIPVHAISNFSIDKFAIARNRFPFLDSFDERIISAEVGLIKPDPAIFELLIRRRSLEPARTVFIDDSAANIATAQMLGFLPVHVHEEKHDVAAALRRYGVPV